MAADKTRAPRVVRDSRDVFASNPPITTTPLVVRPPLQRIEQAQREDLIALELFDEVPGWSIVHAAEDNRNAPMIRRGEIVVVEGGTRAGWYPTEGGLFLAEYRSEPYGGEMFGRISRSIVQTYKNSRGDWHAGSIRRSVATDGVFYCSDGPYNDEGHLAEKLIGRVIGLYRPSLSSREFGA